MKKLIYLFFTVVLFSFFSCGDTENSKGNTHIELEGSSCDDDLEEVSTPCCATKKDTSDCDDSKK